MVLLALVFGVSCVYLWISSAYNGCCRFALPLASTITKLLAIKTRP